MSLIDKIRSQLKDELKGRSASGSQVSYVEMSIPEIPKICEKRGKDWVYHGDDNLYPYKISDLKYGSAIHNALINSAADMIAGEGFLINDSKTPEESLMAYNSLTPEVKKRYDSFLKNEEDPLTLEEINKKHAFDIKEQGSFCFEVIYNTKMTSIARIKYVDTRSVRAGKMEEDVVKSYWISRDWRNAKDYKPKEVPAFGTGGSLNELVYVKRGSLEYYGEPDWIGALTWVQTDFQMGIFHLSNIENGMNPSMKLQFYKLPVDETDKQNILDDIRRSYVGARKTGKHMVFFSEGKELAPTVEPFQTSNLDKQLLLLAELCDKKILTGNRLTSPLLAGISVSGQIGGNTELETAYKIYAKTRIMPMSRMITDSYNKVLEFNKIDVKVKTNPFNPFG